MSTIKFHIWALCALCVIFPTFFAMILIKELSLASCFYISEWNLPRKILETLCEVRGVNSYPVLLSATKKVTRKTISYVYFTFSVNISLILYNNWDRIILKITNLIVILCSHLWKVLCPQSILFLEQVK